MSRSTGPPGWATPSRAGARAHAQTSAHGAAAPCTWDGDAVVFDEPQPLVAPGQTVALYDAADPDAVVGAAVATTSPSTSACAPPPHGITPRYAPAHGGRSEYGPCGGASGSRSCAPRSLYHDEQYYQLDSPEISDADYDALIGELRLLEDAHPELVSPGLAHPPRGGPAVAALLAGAATGRP